MQFNLSDESLGTLQHVLQTAITDAQKRLAKAKRQGDVIRIGAQLADIILLQDIFTEGEGAAAPAPVEPVMDFRVRQDGSVFVFYPQSDGAKAHVITAVKPAAWQMLGGFTFAVDHRLAPDVCYQLREDGFSVEVQ